MAYFVKGDCAFVNQGFKQNLCFCSDHYYQNFAFWQYSKALIKAVETVT